MEFVAINYTSIPFRFVYIGMSFIIIFIALQLSYRVFKEGFKNYQEFMGKINVILGIAFIALASYFLLRIIVTCFVTEQVGAVLDSQTILYILITAAAAICVNIIEPSFSKKLIFLNHFNRFTDSLLCSQ